VHKAIPPLIDLGNLMVVDYGAETTLYVVLPSFRSSFWLCSDETERETHLKALTRDNVQLLVNELFSLPRKTDSDGTFVELPLASMALPRSKPLPEARAKEKTRWERFAERKGIPKRGKRTSHVYDETSKEYLPRHGSKSAKNQPLANWCEEIN
jgi:regulator of ribosome biosynthesis